MHIKEFLTRFKNAGTVLTVASLIILILTTNGVELDNEKLMTTIKGACAILVVLGIMNNPDTSGLDIPALIGKKEEPKEEEEKEVK